MTSMQPRLEEVISRLVHAIRTVAEAGHFEQINPQPRSPASPAAVDAYERFLGRRLPESYRTFLLMHDGYDWLAYPGHMLSISDVMPGSETYDRIIDWKKMTTDYGSGEVLDGIVIAPLGEPNDWVYLDPNKPSAENELTVVAHYPDDSHEFSDLIDFFEERIRYCIVAANLERELHSE